MRQGQGIWKHHGLIIRIAGLCLWLVTVTAGHAQQLEWANRAGGTYVDKGLAIVSDSIGNTYTTGRFLSGTATFGVGQANEITLTASGEGNLFIAKHNSGGSLLWVKQVGGAIGLFIEAESIAADSNSNIYITGDFRGTATFGLGETNETQLTATPWGIFVAKYNISGSLLWAKKVSVTAVFPRSRGIAVDSVGNSYVTGFFTGTITFGPNEVNQTMFTVTSEWQDLFIAKYDSNGNLVWAKRAAALPAGILGFSIGVDSNGNSYVTGLFAGTATFGPGEANQTVLVPDYRDGFVAKYNSSGNLVWVKRIGGPDSSGWDSGFAIAVDADGNSYVTGNFEEVATFGEGEANQTILTSTGSSDMFVAKYTSNGLLVWAKRAGGTNYANYAGDRSIAIDSGGSSYITGTFAIAATFGLGEVNETTLTALETFGTAGIFVARYDSNGDLLWAKQAGGTERNAGLGIAVDGNGNSYVTGELEGTSTFGPGETNETLLTSAGSFDIFVAKFAGGECGDGILQSNLGEQCDDGNLASGDGCDASCTAEPEVCNNCLDDDGDGKIDLADSECSTNSLTVSKGSFTLKPDSNKDQISLSAQFPSTGVTLNPPVDGVAISFFDTDGGVECFAIPRHSPGWKVNGTGTVWSFKDLKDNSLGDPQAEEKVRIRQNGAIFDITLSIKEAEVIDPDAGPIASGIVIGGQQRLNQQPWTEKIVGKKLVTP